MSLFICLTQTCLSQPLDAWAGSREEKENGEEQIGDSHLERGECPRRRDTNQGLAPAAGGLILHRQHKIGWKLCWETQLLSLPEDALPARLAGRCEWIWRGGVKPGSLQPPKMGVSRCCQIFASAGLSTGQGELCVAVESPPHWKYFIGKRDFHISDREFPKHTILLLLNHPDSISDALFAKGCWALQLISLWFAKYPEYPRVCQMSQSARSVTFRCYKNRAIQQHQKGMHWQLWIEMFQHFIPREIHEDCLFTSTQNNISVLRVKISHKVEFQPSIIQGCQKQFAKAFIYTSYESRKVTSLCISWALTKTIRCSDITGGTIKLWQTDSVSLLNLISCQTLNAKAWEQQKGMALIDISCIAWNLSISPNYESEQIILTETNELLKRNKSESGMLQVRLL